MSHGGGPRPLLGDPQHKTLVAALQTMATRLAQPKHIVVISAHWESDPIKITGSASPPLFFDYYGFPEEAYRLQYPAPGAPLLAEKLARTLTDAGFDATLDAERGLDHGVFVPLILMYPNAHVPVLQISLSATLDAASHIALGEALAALDEDGILFLGSGFTFHNMRAFATDQHDIRQANHAFEDWLEATLHSENLNRDSIKQRLIGWETAPGARLCHPREEHLLPLHVCFGIAGRGADAVTSVQALNKRASNYLWLNCAPSHLNRLASFGA